MSTDKLLSVDRKEELIKRGLERSCESLGFFLREKVELETLKFSDAQPSDLQLVNDIHDKEIILYSEIFGQIGGQCFFLLDLKEADILFRKNFTATGNAMPQQQIFDAFLLELDNIITASVVTQFADSLKLKIFGGVPNIYYKKDEEKLQQVLQKAKTAPHTINFKCRYKIESIEFSPMFFWALDAKFMELISQSSR